MRLTNRLLAALGVLIALAVVAAPQAAAHSDLVSSSPADGSETQSAPSQVVLTFNENIATTGLQVVAQGPSGPLELGDPTVTGPTVTSAWPQDEPGGEYQLSYRVVSADGHPIDGTITFSYASDRAVPADVPSTDPADQAASPDTGAVDAAEPTAATTAQSGDFPLWLPVIVVIAGVAIGATIARVLRRRSASGTSQT